MNAMLFICPSSNIASSVLYKPVCGRDPTPGPIPTIHNKKKAPRVLLGGLHAKA